MQQWSEKAYAKVNLTLDVQGKRPDGYHDLRMLMQTVSLCDTVTLTATGGEGLRVTSDLEYLPTGEKNLAGMAALAFFRHIGRPAKGVSLHIRKEIPVCAGLGGGSADAAAVLRLLNRVYGTGLSAARLEEMAAEVGSDVPFCVRGGTRLAEGRGERLTDVSPLPPCHVVLCKPPYTVSTGAAFARWGGARSAARPDLRGALAALAESDLRGLARFLYNVLEDVLPVAASDVAHIRGALMDAGALGVVMSGSGPTVLGLCDDAQRAGAAGEALRGQYKETFVCEAVGEV